MQLERKSGILLHPSSLPGPYGIGEIGLRAFEFVDQLVEMGQGLWQVLPLGPTGYGDSPYQSLSTFATNDMLICFDSLVADGLLDRSALKPYPRFSRAFVDYGPVIEKRKAILNTVCDDFDEKASSGIKAGFESFCMENTDWLEDYALFIALKEHNDLRPWPEWPRALVHREEEALAEARATFSEVIVHVKILQYLFFRQWRALRAYCHERQVELIGDIPIFVAHDSADVWAHPELFYMDSDGHPTVVAGVPPDYFSETGQLWGNPLYRWDYHKETNYAWWVRRLKMMYSMYDIVRIDHFRGFEKYWEVPGGAETAMTGHWVDGPAYDFFDAIFKQLGEVAILAEDLGLITPEVDALRDRYELPGMRILQFAFGEDEKADAYRPESYPANCAVYTGTHDNDTTVGWFNSSEGGSSTRSAEEIQRENQQVLDYLGSDGSEIHWDLIELAWRSNGNTAVVPMQDILGLGSEARMNVPGVTAGNWGWRMTKRQLKKRAMKRLHKLTEETNRLQLVLK